MNEARSSPTVKEQRYWRGRRVLVTGIGGFVGSRLAEELLARGASVVGIVRDSRGEALLGILGLTQRVELVRGSLTNYLLVERTVNQYEINTCFHLAAQAIVGTAHRSPISSFDSNIRGTWNVLEACRQNPTVAAVVVASSDKVYGDQQRLPYTEESPLSAVYPYDVSKACADLLARCYYTTYGLPLAIARCANIYGGGDLSWSRLIPGTIRSVLLVEEPIIRSDGTLERDYIHISDAVTAYLTLADRLHREEVRGQAFNFGSGRPVSVSAVVEKILAAASANHLRPHVLGQTSGEIRRQYLDSAKANRLLGWQVTVALDEGLRQTIPWYEEYLSQHPFDRDRPDELAAKGKAKVEARG